MDSGDDEHTMDSDGEDLDLENLSKMVYRACRLGEGECLENLLRKLKPETVKEILNTHTYTDVSNVTPLVIAAMYGHIQVVDILIQKFHVDLEQTGTVKYAFETQEGATALVCAAAENHFDIVKYLVQHGADVNHCTDQNSSPLRDACMDGNVDMAQYLLDHGADIRTAYKNTNTCLIEACRYSHYDIVKCLIKNEADCDFVGDYGRTALHTAAGDVDIVKLLVESGATIKKDDHNISPLMHAAAIGNVDVVEYLSKLPECSRQEKIEALELLGASYLDPYKWNKAKAYTYLRTAMEERYNLSVDKVIESPIPAYDNRKECQTLSELESIKDSDKALHMESLIIKERILGCSPLMIEALMYMRMKFRDAGMYNECITMLLRALKLSQKTNLPFSPRQFVYEFVALADNEEIIDFNTLLDVSVHANAEVELDLSRASKINVMSGDDARRNHLENIKTSVYLIILLLQVTQTTEERDKVYEVVRRFV